MPKKNLSLREQRLIKVYQQYFSEFPGQTSLNITFANVTEENGIYKRIEKPVSLEKARKYFFYFFNHLNKHEDFYKKFVHFWFFIEQNPHERKGVHLHALMDGIIPEMIPSLNTRCNDTFGESEVKVRDKHTIPYLAKKCISPHLIDFNYYKINSRYRSNRRLP